MEPAAEIEKLRAETTALRKTLDRLSNRVEKLHSKETRHD